MIPYFIVFFICFLFSLFDLFVKNNSLKNKMLLFFGLIFIFFAGLRWETGTDWDNYFDAFNSIENAEIGESGYEFFYELLLRFSMLLSNEYTLVTFLTAIIILVLTTNTIKKYSPYPLFSLLLLLSYSINSIGFGYRQDLAISFCFFSTYFILKRKLLLFCLLVLIAILFHQSAIIFLPAYWVSQFIWNKKTIIYLTLLIIIFYILFSQLASIASIYSQSAAYKVSNYSEMSQEESLMGNDSATTLLFRGLINRILIFLPPLLILFSTKTRNSNFMHIFNIMFFGLVLFILLSPLGYVFLRFTRYYELYQILLIPLAIYFSTPKFRYLLISFYILYCVFKFSYVLFSDNNIYVPYQTIFSHL